MDDLLQTVVRFHREVVLPDIERVVSSVVDGSERRLRDEMHAIFDTRLDRLETEYHMIVAGRQQHVRLLEAKLSE